MFSQRPLIGCEQTRRKSIRLVTLNRTIYSSWRYDFFASRKRWQPTFRRCFLVLALARTQVHSLEANATKHHTTLELTIIATWHLAWSGCEFTFMTDYYRKKNKDQEKKK